MKDGCEISLSCERCPLDDCIYGKEKGYKKSQRNKEINRLYHKGISVEELAKRFQVTTRTIDRAIKKQSRVIAQSDDDIKVLTS